MFDFGLTDTYNFALNAMRGANYDNTEFFDPHALDREGRYGITDADRKAARLEGIGALGAGLTRAAFAKDWSGVGEGIGMGLIGGSQANRSYLDKLSKTRIDNLETGMKFKQANATLRNTELAGDTAEYALQKQKEDDELERKFADELEPVLSTIEEQTPTFGFESKLKEAEFKARVTAIRANILKGNVDAVADLEKIRSLIPQERLADVEQLIEEKLMVRSAERDESIQDAQAYNKAGIPWEAGANGPQMMSPQEAAQKAANLAYTRQATASSAALEEDRRRDNQGNVIKQANILNGLYGDYAAAKTEVAGLAKQLSPANQQLRMMPQNSLAALNSRFLAAQAKLRDVKTQMNAYGLDPEQPQLPFSQIVDRVRNQYSPDPNLQSQAGPDQDEISIQAYMQLRQASPNVDQAMIIDALSKKLANATPQTQAAFKKQMLLLLKQRGIQ